MIEGRNSETMMNLKTLEAHVQRLVQNVIAEHTLPARPTMEQVRLALELPPPTHVLLGPNNDGMIVGRQIYINDRLTLQTRMEFTFFHEVVHFLIEEDGEITSQLHDYFIQHYEKKEDATLEHLCNVGAAEFIMPGSTFRERMKVADWSLTALPETANYFGASLTAVAFRFVELHPLPRILIVCAHAVLPTSSNSAPCLHITHCHHNDGGYPMCRSVPIPRDHFIHAVWDDGDHKISQTHGFFTNPKKWNMPCEAARFGNRVFALYSPSAKKSAIETATHPSLDF